MTSQITENSNSMDTGDQRERDARENMNLPDIDQLPESDIVIYDGDCKFCQAQVGKLNWFAGGRLTFVSLHDERVAARFPELSREQLMEQMFVVAPDGSRYGGAAALRYLSRRLPRLWFASPLLHIPFSLPLWQGLYGLIARYRYRFAGKSGQCDGDACRIHFDQKKK